MKYKFEEIAFNSTQKKQPEDSDREFYIGLEHIDPQCFRITRWGSEVTPAGEKLVMKKGDVLFGKRRAYQRKVAIAPFDGIFSAHGMVLRPKTSVIDENFFPFFISSDQFMETAVRISVGGLSPTINWKDLKVQEFDLPSLEDQKILADKLWAAYRLKEAYQRLLSATDEMVKSQFIEMFGNPISNDRNWDYECINSVAPESPAAHVDDDQVWLLNLDMIESNTGNIIEKVVVPKSDVLSAQPFDEGNVLFSKLRPYLNKVVCPKDKGYATTELVPLRPNHDKLNKIFFTYLLRSNQFVQFANDISSGTKMPRMPLKELREFKCILPPIYLQEEFASIVRQADKSKFDGFKSQFIEMFGSVESFSALENIVSDTFPGEWGNEPTSSNAIKVIRTTNFTNEGRLDLSEVVTREIDFKKVSRKKLKKGDTLLERSGGTKDNPVGRVVFFDEDGDYLFNNFTQVLRPKENVNPVYLFYSLYNSYNLNKAAMRAMASQTTGIQNLSMSDYMAKQIKLPSKKLQDKFESIYRQADKSKYYVQNKLNYICHILTNQIQLRRCS